MSGQIIERTLGEATGISPEEAAQLWSQMHANPYRKLLQFEIEKRLSLERAACATATIDKISRQQGVVEGLVIALGIMARKDPKPPTG